VSAYLLRRLRSESEARRGIAAARETEWYRKLGGDEMARMIEDGKLCRDCSENCADTCCVKCRRWERS
jgi:hypothetical protein